MKGLLVATVAAGQSAPYATNGDCPFPSAPTREMPEGLGLS